MESPNVSYGLKLAQIICVLTKMKNQLITLLKDLTSLSDFTMVPSKQLTNVILSLAPNLRISFDTVILNFKKLPFNVWKVSFGHYFSLSLQQTELFAVLKNALNACK